MTDTINLYVGESVGAAANGAAAAAASAAAANLSAAAAAASAAGRIFSSYANGNAATTAGQYFWVPAAAGLDLYLRGAEVVVVRLPTLNTATGALTVASTVALSWGAAVGAAAVIGGANGAGASMFIKTPSLSNGFVSGLGIGGSYASLKSTVRIGAYGVFSGGGYSANLALGASSGTGYGDILILDGSNATVRPASDNISALGTGSQRFTVVFAATGTINTSDESQKTWRGGFTAPELAAAKDIAASIGVFQWNDAIAEKGADADAGGARLHFGVKAQQVWGIMASHGLLDAIDPETDPSSKYAFLCWDDLGGGDGRFGVRPDQLALFLIAAQEARIAALEAV